MELRDVFIFFSWKGLSAASRETGFGSLERWAGRAERTPGSRAGLQMLQVLEGDAGCLSGMSFLF